MPDHFQLQTGSPIYCLEWLAEDVLVYAGGGGKGRSGVGNYMRVLHVPRTAKAPTDVDVLAELKLSSEEDAPMSMAIEPRTNSIVLGINEADDEKLQGNEHLRIYQCDIVRNSDAKPTATLTAQSSAPSLPLKDAAESYLRLLAFSPAGDQLVSASTDGRYALHDWPSLKPVFQSTDDFVGQEIVDADFSQDGNQLVLCTGSKLKVFGTFPNPAASPTSSSSPSSSSAGGDYVTVSKTEATLAINQSLSLGPKSSLDDVKATHAAKSTADAAAPLTKPPTWQTIQNPALGGEGGCEFRAVRFGKPAEQPAKAAATEPPSEKDEKPPPATSTTPPSSPSSRSLFTVVNAKASAATGKGTKAKRKAFLTSWKLPSTSLVLTRQLSEKPITTCALSERGSLLAYGSSDLSVGIVDAQSLRVVARILNAHGFPATRVAWSRRGTKSNNGDEDVWLASASADGTLRVVRVAEAQMANATNQTVLLTVLLTIIILLLAMYIQKNALV